ncbi:MAG: DnaJ domain-containing protein [Candidatus Adiutrix sp.]|jgi:curved DNA-binding protein|nr:DnaJ domain-containing protein [Candidatus Adiutrix sp.]
MAQADYYAVLGVIRGASAEELKRAYRRLAVQWHPDRNPGSKLAEERFKTIAEAYAVLSNPSRRRQYDLLGPVKFKNEYSHEEIFQGFEPGDFLKFFGLADARDTLSRIFSGQAAPVEQEDPRARISDFFDGFGQKKTRRDQRSPDIAVPLLVSFKEAALGADKFVAYNIPGGAVKVPVSVPPGAQSGQRLVVRARGPARPGDRPGDVVVTLTVSPDPDFSRRGFDLLTSLELNEGQMADGCRPLVQPLSGQALRLTIPPGTRAGANFKIPGYGLKKPDGGQGDLLVKIKKSADG